MLEKVKEIVSDSLGADINTITEATSFKDDLGADSLDLFEVVMAFEEEFDVEIEQTEAADIRTVQEAADYLEKLTAEK